MDRLNMSLLTSIQKRNRLHFAFANRNTDWTKVVFSGEIKIGPIGIWASIDEDGPCRMRFFERLMDGEKYVSILEDIILPLNNRKENMILMQVSYIFPNF